MFCPRLQHSYIQNIRRNSRPGNSRSGNSRPGNKMEGNVTENSKLKKQRNQINK